MLAKRQLINSSIGLDWAVVLTVLGRSIINSVVFCVVGSKAIQDISKARNFWFPFSSRSQVVMKKSSNDTFFSFKKRYWVKRSSFE